MEVYSDVSVEPAIEVFRVQVYFVILCVTGETFGASDGNGVSIFKL
jgi:hypothetical protein